MPIVFGIVVVGTLYAKFLGMCTNIYGYVHKGCSMMIKNRSHAMSCATWACHLYPVAIGALPAA